MPFIVTFQNFNSWPQSKIIPDATSHNDGVMTAAQAAKLAGLIPGSAGYVVVENGGAILPQETTLNFDGTALVASDDPGSLRTNVVLANTAVTPAAYGDSTHVASFTVDQQGRLTAAADVAIAFPPPPPATTTLQDAYDNGAAGQQVIQESVTNLGITINANGVTTFAANLPAFFVLNSSVTDPGTGAAVGVGVNTSGELDGYATSSVGKIIRLSGGIDNSGTATVWDNGFVVMPPPTPAAAIAPAGQLILRAADGVFAGVACGGTTVLAGMPGAGGAPAGVILGLPQNAWNAGGMGNHDATKPFFFTGNGAGSAPEWFGGGSGMLQRSGSVIDAQLGLDYFTLPGALGAGGLGLNHNGNLVWSVNESEMAYTSHTAANVAVTVNTSADFSAGSNALLSVQNNSTPRFEVFPSQSRVGVFTGCADANSIGPVVITGTTGGHGSGIFWSGWAIDARAETGGEIWSCFAGSFTPYGGAASFFEIANLTASKQVLISYGSGNLRLGTSAAAITDPGFGVSTDGTMNIGGALTLDNKIISYNGETTAGVGVAYELAVGTDVASSGAGAQNTTVAAIASPVDGQYRISISVSSIAADASVTISVTFTDAVNTTAQTFTPILTEAFGANDADSAVVIVRANNTTPLTVAITQSNQAGTHVSATIERIGA